MSIIQRARAARTAHQVPRGDALNDRNRRCAHGDRASETRVAVVPEIAAKIDGPGRDRADASAAPAASPSFPTPRTRTSEFADAAERCSRRPTCCSRCSRPASSRSTSSKAGAVVIGFMQAHARPDDVKALRDRHITSFAMELVPRISRAQSMDALSSQAAVAGYKAVLIAANTLDSFLPMLTTAAGTIRPAQVLVIGAGVAGLQAIATAKRLGAVVEAYDVRSATKEQVQVARREIRRHRRFGRRHGRLRARTHRGGEGEAAGSARQPHRGRRRGDHHGLRAGPPRAAHHVARRGRAHEGRAP